MFVELFVKATKMAATRGVFSGMVFGLDVFFYFLKCWSSLNHEIQKVGVVQGETKFESLKIKTP